MSTPAGAIAIQHEPAANRFAANVEGRLAVIEYERREYEIVLTHTFVPPELRGRGLAEQLVRAALDFARAEKLRVVPACSYVASFVARHAEYRSLLTFLPATIPPPQLVAALTWRYATKKFEPAKTIPADVWHALEQSLVLAPSSIGLQPWKFVVVTDPEVKEALVAASHRQTQPRDCSHFVALAARRNLDAAHVDRHIARVAEVRSVNVESLAKFRTMTMGNLEQARAAGTLDAWQEHQVYIALGQFMASAAVLGVDTCPMEGIEPEKFDEILGLAGSGFATVVACAAGYRLADDKYATTPKVRFKTEDVIQRV